ncbi:hypothetical protein BDC45DRAFT_497219 [Circinella umbellata]|nr:hypothetical protein BDC45DRAFT_497219 [Circinella umbellata]
MDNINIGNRPDAEHEYNVNDTNMSAIFYDYKFFQESHLHEMLGSFIRAKRVLLLKTGEYSPTMLKVFKEDDLVNMTKELRNEFIAGDRFDEDLKVEIEKLLEMIDSFTEDELQDVVDEMNNKAYKARKNNLNNEAKILKCLRNMFENLPYASLGVETSEADLVTSFLEQLLRPLLSTRKSRLRWPNAKAEISTTTTTSHRTTSNRPDAKVSNMCGINYGEACAFGEIKPDEHAKDNYLLAKDLLRLCVFGKDSIDKDHMYATMLFQAVVICNVDKNNKQQLEDMARDTLDTPSFRTIIDPTKSKTRLRHVNFN